MRCACNKFHVSESATVAHHVLDMLYFAIVYFRHTLTYSCNDLILSLSHTRVRTTHRHGLAATSRGLSTSLLPHRSSQLWCCMNLWMCAYVVALARINTYVLDGNSVNRVLKAECHSTHLHLRLRSLCMFGVHDLRRTAVLRICPHCWHILIKLISIGLGWHTHSRIPKCIQYFRLFIYLFITCFCRFRPVLWHLLCTCSCPLTFSLPLSLLLSAPQPHWTCGRSLSTGLFASCVSLACAFFGSAVVLSNIISMTRWDVARRTNNRKTFARSSLAVSYSAKWNYLRK